MVLSATAGFDVQEIACNPSVVDFAGGGFLIFLQTAASAVITQGLPLRRCQLIQCGIFPKPFHVLCFLPGSRDGLSPAAIPALIQPFAGKAAAMGKSGVLGPLD